VFYFKEQFIFLARINPSVWLEVARRCVLSVSRCKWNEL